MGGGSRKAARESEFFFDLTLMERKVGGPLVVNVHIVGFRFLL